MGQCRRNGGAVWQGVGCGGEGGAEGRRCKPGQQKSGPMLALCGIWHVTCLNEALGLNAISDGLCGLIG